MNILRPDIPSELVPATNLARLLSSDETLRELHITDAESSRLRTKGLTINESAIEGSNFSQATVEKFSTRDCRFDDCDLTASSFADSSWHTIEILHSRCSGMQLQSSVLKNVLFKGDKLDMANFRFAELNSVVFEDCVINEIDFYNAKLKNVTFINCDIEDAEFSGAKLDNVDLTGSQIISLKGVESLKGARVSNSQLIYLAPYFAQALGLIVKD